MIRPTDVGETQKFEGLRLPFPTLPPAFRGIAPKLDPTRFIRVPFQSELPPALPPLPQETLGVVPVLKSHDEVVGVPHDDYITARLLLSPPLHPDVEDIMQIEIGQDRRDHRTLGRPHPRLGPLPLLEHARLQPFLDQADYSPVSDPMLHKLRHPFVVDVVKEPPYVGVEHPVHFPARDPYRQRVQRIVLAAPRPESVGKAQKVLFPDLVENRPYRVLYDFVFQCRDPQWSLPSIGLRDPDSPRRLRSIGSTMDSSVKVLQPLLQAFSIFLPRHPVRPRRRLPWQAVVALPEQIHGPLVQQSSEPYLPVSSCCLPHTVQPAGLALP